MEKSVKKLIIKAKREVFSEIPGNNPSIFRGEGFDFVELREYQYGDDVKKIDWLISAKLQKPYVKIFKEERELNVVLAAMLDGGTYFGSRVLKRDQMVYIAALIGFSAIKNRDRFCGFIFADREYGFFKPTKSSAGVTRFCESMGSFSPLGKTGNYDVMIERLFRIKRRSLIFVLADFLDFSDMRVLARKHEVVAVIVRDEMEESPPELGFVTLLDAGGRESMTMDLDSRVVSNYKKELKKRDFELYEHLKKAGIRFLKIYTHDKPFAKLLRFFG